MGSKKRKSLKRSNSSRDSNTSTTAVAPKAAAPTGAPANNGTAPPTTATPTTSATSPTGRGAPAPAASGSPRLSPGGARGRGTDHSGTTLHIEGEGILERLWSAPCLRSSLNHCVHNWSESHIAYPLLDYEPDAALIEIALNCLPPVDDDDVSLAVRFMDYKAPQTTENVWELLERGIVTRYSLRGPTAEQPFPPFVLRCHIAERHTSVEPRRSTPWLLGKLLPCPLSEEIGHFVALVGLTAREEASRRALVGKITAALTARWPTASLTEYGSFAYGLSLPQADIDLCVSGIALDPIDGLQTAASILERVGVSCRPILSARVPVVKLRDRVLGVAADLTWAAPHAGGLAPVGEGVPLVQRLLEEHPAAAPLVLVLKMLLRQHELHEPREGGLGSLAVTIMVLAFLQAHAQPKTLPTWHRCACADPTDAGELLVDFFRFFGLEFDYLANFVTVLPAPDGPFPPLRSRPAAAPAVLFDRTGMHTVMVVQDPITPTNNLASVCRESRMVLQLFARSYAALTCCDGSRMAPSLLGLVLCAEEGLWERQLLRQQDPTPPPPSTPAPTAEPHHRRRQRKSPPPPVDIPSPSDDSPSPAETPHPPDAAAPPPPVAPVKPATGRPSHPRLSPSDAASPAAAHGNGGQPLPPQPVTPSAATATAPQAAGTCVHQRLSSQPFHVNQLLHLLRPPAADGAAEA